MLSLGIVRCKLVALPQSQGAEYKGHKDSVYGLQPGKERSVDVLDTLIGSESEGDGVADKNGRLCEGKGEAVP